MRPARMIRVALSVGLLVIASGLGASPAQDVPRPAAALPRPPQQDAPWTPPRSALPRALVVAAEVLFQQGLADPRGCAYREVELPGEAEFYRHRSGRPRPIHAWVLPSEATGGPRYAIGWNGLVYPAARLGPAADLEADVEALAVPGGPPPRGGRPYSWPNPLAPDPMYRGRAFSEIETASQGDASPTKVVLLLRLGRADLAEHVWRCGNDWSKDVANPQVSVYANLAADWEWALLDRAAAAHARGDDRLALASLRELARIRPMIEARPGVVKPPPFPGGFDFLVEFPRFLADQERRAREPARRPAVEAMPADRAARIAAPLRDFDRLSQGLPHQQGGPVGPYWDAAFQAVVKEGDAAVGPLLDCLERDNRLTRVVERDARFRSRYLHVQGVDEFAYQALVSILGTREFGPEARVYSGRSDRLRRKAVAAEIHDYWKKNRKLGPLDRLFATLADDGATTDQWISAAETLIQPIIVRRPGLEYMVPRHRSRGVPLRGEPLRSRTNPSVTELLARRTREIDEREGHPDPLLHARPANRMAVSVAAWDPKGALPTLRARMARSVAALREKPANAMDIYVAEVEIKVAAFTMLRARGGDLAALDEYADWIRTRPRPGRLRHFEPEIFEPMWSYPDHPSIAAAAVALFDRPGSPWVPLFGPDDVGWGERGTPSDVIVSPMLGVAPFRKQVLVGLEDDRLSGSIRCDEQGQVTIALDAQRSQLPMFRRDDPDRPRPGTSEPIRLRDKYAWKLQEVMGFPRMEFHWPRERRDRAIAGAIEALSRYGERFRTTEVSQALHERESFYPRFVRAVLVFAPLDRPATPEDVAAGRAIFAAGPGAEVRRWAPPAVPMEARWMGQDIAPDDPHVRQFERMPPKHSSRLHYAQHGLVWQAEEVREGDRWRRYFGFVGHHVIARLPAEEVDFPSEWNIGWNELSRDVEAKLIPPGGHDDGLSILVDPVPAGGPLPIVLSLRNRRGIAVAAPTDLARPGGMPALRDGVTIRVRLEPEAKKEAPVAGPPRSGRPQPDTGAGGQQGGTPSAIPWPEIAPRREPERYRSDAAKALGPTETVEVLRFDLRDLFDPVEPGRYRVEVELPGIRTEGGKPASAWADFLVRPAVEGVSP